MSLEVRNITACFGKQAVVHDISLTAPKGQLSIVIGPNGSGKSTLIRCLARAHRPYSGAVLLDGRDTSTLTTRDAAKQIAYVPQDNAMPFAFTIAELVGLSDRSEAEREKALNALDLMHLRQRSVNSLSGGERQRAALARGLAQATPYLLLDEPTAHLDMRHQKMLLETLRQRAAETQTTVLIALHDLNLAAAYGDTIFLLKEGVLTAQGTPGEVLTEETLRRCYQTDVFVTAAGRDSKPFIHLNPNR